MEKMKFWSFLAKGTLFVILLICVVLTTPAFGWITSGRSVEAEPEIQLDGSMIMSSRFDAYKYVDTDGYASLVTGEDITLPLYDTIFTERNENSTLIFRVPVFGTEINQGTAFTITLNLQDLSDETGLEDYNYHNGNKIAHDGSSVPRDAIADYVSNVVYVKCAVIDALQEETVTLPADWSTGEADYIYQTAHAFFKNNTVERHTFVTSETVDNVTTFSKPSNEISFTVSDYDMAEDAVILYVYLEIGYDQALVNHMNDTRGLSFAFDGNNEGIPITSDLDIFIFSPVKSN